MTKSKPSNALVLATAKKPRQRTSKVVRSLQDSSDQSVKQYRLALANPFHPSAEGVRVPDLFSAHTQTYKFRSATNATVDSSGNLVVQVFPNPQYAAYAATGTIAGGGNIIYCDGITNTGRVVGWTMPTSVQAWRIVAMGVRVTSTSSMTNAQGKLVCGTFPIDSYLKVKTWNGVAIAIGATVEGGNTAITQSVTQTAWGIPTSTGVVNYGAMVEYPGAQVISGLEVAEKEIDIIPRPVDPRAFEFNNIDTLVGFDTPSQVTSGYSGRASSLRLAGFESAFIVYTGGVANTTSLDVEIVYHVEATYAPNTAVGFTQPAAASGMQSPNNPAGFWKAIQEAVQKPAVRTGIVEGASMIHPILGGLARAVI